jgi:putative tryptophan/tyrosine transport system substrate-binding protein
VRARAQQADKVRRLGVLIYAAENDQLVHTGACGAGSDRWPQPADGRSLAAGSVDLARTYAKELVALQPDVILANATPQTAALQQATRTTPWASNSSLS